MNLHTMELIVRERQAMLYREATIHQLMKQQRMRQPGRVLPRLGKLFRIRIPHVVLPVFVRRTRV